MPSTIARCGKAAGRGVLSAGIVATKGAEWGLNFTSGCAKIFVGGAKNLANEFAPGIDFGMGKFLYDTTEKAVNWGLNQTIKAQKTARGMLR